MKLVPLNVPDALRARLRDEAARPEITISELNREALETYLSGGSRRRRLGAMNAGRSGRADVSERIEEILAAGPRPSP